MSTLEDFENAPVGATATHDNGSRAMKMNDSERGWIIRTGHYWSGEIIGRWGYTLDVPARSLPTRDELAEAIYDVLSSKYGDFNNPTDAADAVLALLKGQDK